jgi:hypothetical protein
MPLCEGPPYAGEAVVLAIPEATAVSHMLPPAAVPKKLAWLTSSLAMSPPLETPELGCSTSWSNAARDGQQENFRWAARRRPLGAVRPKDVAKYFVPVRDIKTFIPRSVSF